MSQAVESALKSRRLAFDEESKSLVALAHRMISAYLFAVWQGNER